MADLADGPGSKAVGPFGARGEGLVTFLFYPPDDLVLVLRIHWLGE